MAADPSGLDRWKCGGFGHSWVVIEDPDNPNQWIEVHFYPDPIGDLFAPGVVSVTEVPDPGPEARRLIKSSPSADRQAIEFAQCLQKAPPRYNVILRNCHTVAGQVAQEGLPRWRPERGWRPLCFVSDTLVLTEDGLQKIEDIEPGNDLLSLDIVHGSESCSQITTLSIGLTWQLVIIDLPTGPLTCTAEHPFWVPERGWVRAAELSPGDGVLTADRTTVEVLGVSFQSLDYPVRVYSLSVDGDHTYYVGHDRVLVHNKPR